MNKFPKIAPGQGIESLASVLAILIAAMLAKEGHGIWALAGVFVLYPACFTLQRAWRSVP